MLFGIDWKKRAKKKTFWLTIVPALLLVAQIVGSWFGYEVPAEVIGAEAERFINAVFVVLTLVGVVSDQTTKGVRDNGKDGE